MEEKKQIANTLLVELVLNPKGNEQLKKVTGENIAELSKILKSKNLNFQKPIQTKDNYVFDNPQYRMVLNKTDGRLYCKMKSPNASAADIKSALDAMLILSINLKATTTAVKTRNANPEQEAQINSHYSAFQKLNQSRALKKQNTTAKKNIARLKKNLSQSLGDTALQAIYNRQLAEEQKKLKANEQEVLQLDADVKITFAPPAKQPVPPKQPPLPQKDALVIADAAAGPESTKGFHHFLDLHRNFLNTKLAGSDFTLVGYALKHKTDNSSIEILDNGHMHSDGIPFSEDQQKIIEDKLFERLRAMLIVYSGLHAKNCPTPEPIKLRLSDNGKLTPEQQTAFNAMATRIGQRIQEELKKEEYQGIRHNVRYLGRGATHAPTAVAAPDAAPTPGPTAPQSNAPAPPPRPLDPKESEDLLTKKTVLPEMTVIQKDKIGLKNYQDNLIGTDPKKSAFIFPGNNEHAKKNGLHHIPKGYGGLAAAAEALSDAGIGTLSLPTTLYSLSDPTAISQLAKSEMAKLWEAVGRGYQLVLPVRDKSAQNDQFFNQTHRNTIENITGNTNLEPSFWGSIQTSFAPGTENFPQYYTQELAKLQSFIKTWNNAPDKTARQDLLNKLGQKDPDFRGRFEQGLRLAAQKPAHTAAAAHQEINPNAPKI